MLPRLAHIVPVKAKLGQFLPHCQRWFNLELNPHPFADDLGALEETRRLAAKQIQQPPCVQRTIQPPFDEVNLGSVSRARWFGTALKL